MLHYKCSYPRPTGKIKAKLTRSPQIGWAHRGNTGRCGMPDAISGDDLSLAATYPQCLLGSVDRIQLCLIMETSQTPRFTVPEHSPANVEFTTRKRARFFTLYGYRSPKEMSAYAASLASAYRPERLRAGPSNAGAMDTRHSKGLASSAKAQISLSPTDSLTPCYLPRTILSADSTSDADRYKGSLAAAELKE